MFDTVKGQMSLGRKSLVTILAGVGVLILGNCRKIKKCRETNDELLCDDRKRTSGQTFCRKSCKDHNVFLLKHLNS